MLDDRKDCGDVQVGPILKGKIESRRIEDKEIASIGVFDDRWNSNLFCASVYFL